MNGLISLVFNGFPPGYCYPGDPNDLGSDLISYTDITFNATGNVYYNYGNTVPAVDNRVYHWVKTLTDVSGPAGIWVWNSTESCWTMHHPVPSSAYDPYLRRIHIGTTADLETIDWSDSNAVGDASGPFWQVDTNFAFRMPLGAGTSPAGTIVVPTDTGGEETHVLTVAELAKHYHVVWPADNLKPAVANYDWTRWEPTGGSSASSSNTKPVEPHTTGGAPTELWALEEGNDDAHNNMPPYYGVYFIKRTARLYYRIL